MEIVFELLKKDEINEFSQVVIDIVNEISKEDYDENGYIFVTNYAGENEINERINISTFFVAKFNDKIIGTLEIMSPGTMSYDNIIDNNVFSYINIAEKYIVQLFFVANKFRHNGIGKKLLEFAKEYLRNNFPENKLDIFVHSSTYAVKIYESFSFKRVAEVQNINGIRYVPMVYIEK